MSVQRYTDIIYQVGDPTPYVRDDVGSFVPLFSGILGNPAEARYVDKNGSDTTGNGSPSQPYATRQKAIDSITDATVLKPYNVIFGPGVWTDSWRAKPYVFMVGSGPDSSIEQNPAANWVSADFGGAGTLESGLYNCQLGIAQVVDFAAVASPGAGKFYFNNCKFGAFATTWTGNNGNNRIFAQNCSDTLTALHPITVTHVTARIVASNTAFFQLTMNCTGAIGTNFFPDIWNSIVAMNGTSVTNFAQYAASHTTQTTLPTFTGDRVIYSPGVAAVTRFAVNVDTDMQFTWSTVVAGAQHLATNGRMNVFQGAALTATRTWTFNGTLPSAGSILYLTGPGASPPNNFPINLVGLSSPSVIDPLENITWKSEGGGMTALDAARIQYGLVTLTNGLSPVIPIDNPAIIATFGTGPNGPQTTALLSTQLYDVNGSVAIGVKTKILNINSVGTRRAGTSNFQFESLTAAGVREVQDQGKYLWSCFVSGFG